jgi:hypothetical protein
MYCPAICFALISSVSFSSFPRRLSSSSPPGNEIQLCLGKVRYLRCISLIFTMQIQHLTSWSRVLPSQAAIPPVNQEMPRLLQSLEFHYTVQSNECVALDFPQSYFNFVITSMTRCSKLLLSVRFYNQNFVRTSNFPMCSKAIYIYIWL